MQNPIFALMAVVIATGVAAGPSQGATQTTPAADEKPFLAENNAAMDKMMAGYSSQADRRCRCRFRRDDDPAPPGCDRVIPRLGGAIPQLRNNASVKIDAVTAFLGSTNTREGHRHREDGGEDDREH